MINEYVLNSWRGLVASDKIGTHTRNNIDTGGNTGSMSPQICLEPL